MSRIAAALLAALLMAPVASPAVAQRGVDVDLSLTPHVGLLTPAEWFYYEITVFGEGPMEWTEAAVLRSTVVGATAAADFSSLGMSIRGTLLRTVDAKTYVAFAVMNAGPFTPADVVRTRYRVPTDVTLASLDVVLPTRLRLPLRVQPYFMGGVGGKHYAFDRSVLAGADESLVPPEGGTTLLLNVGGGLVVPLTGGFELDLQIRDAISDYWDERQHDVLWMAGLSWSAFRL